MYFQELHCLKSALNQLRTELMPSLNAELILLHENAAILGEVELSEGLFSIIATKLKSETEAMNRLLSIILIPLIEEIILNPESSPNIQSFAVLRTYHNRMKEHFAEMREMCNHHIVTQEWSHQKRVSCLSVYHAELAFIKYANFMETTMFSLLNPMTIQSK